MGVETDVVGFFLTLLFGLCLGSFSTAVVHRLPRGESMIAKERSACPSCRHKLGIVDLVPVFSYLFLRGRCRHCQTPIGMTYLLVELLIVALVFLLYWRFGYSSATLMLYFLSAALISIVFIDLANKIIPDSLNVSVGLLALSCIFFLSHSTASPPDFILQQGIESLAGAAVLGGGALLLRHAGSIFIGREPLGLGDVKFFAAAGFWLGLDAYAFAIWFFLSGVFGVVLAFLWRYYQKDPEFPFGPALALALFAVLIGLKPAFLQLM